MFDSLLLTVSLAIGQNPGLPVHVSPTPIVVPHYQSMPVRQGQPVMMMQNQVPAQLPNSVPVIGGPAPVIVNPAPIYSSAPVYTPVEAAPEEEAEDEAPVYAFMQLLEGTRLAESGISISGWVGMNYTESTSRITNLPQTLNDMPDAYQMNQNYLKIGKAIDTSKDEFQLGFTTETILPGTDYRFTTIRGLFDSQLTDGPNGGPNLYGFDPFQFYAEAFLPGVGPQGTSVKVGRFATHVGYELVQQADTPFVSKSYLFQYNPFTHTGVFATTPLNDDWTVSYGVATGSDIFLDEAGRATFLGQLKWAPKEGKTQVLFNTVVTDPRRNNADNFNHYNVYNLLLIHQIGCKTTYVADATFSHESGIDGLGSTNWYGIANYIFYKHTDKITSQLRAEVFEDTDGFRTGFAGTYTEATYGVAWTPVPALIIRPSVRYDYNADSRPFDGSDNQWTGTIETIIRY